MEKPNWIIKASWRHPSLFFNIVRSKNCQKQINQIGGLEFARSLAWLSATNDSDDHKIKTQLLNTKHSDKNTYIFYSKLFNHKKKIYKTKRRVNIWTRTMYIASFLHNLVLFHYILTQTQTLKPALVSLTFILAVNRFSSKLLLQTYRFLQQ